MRYCGLILWIIGCGAAAAALAAPAEWNPVRSRPVEIGPETHRLIVGLRTSASADVAGLAQRAGLALSGSHQIAPRMHVMFLQKTLFGADVEAALGRLRSDPAVRFAELDQRRYPLLVPDDPLFPVPNPTAGVGQWFMLTPDAATCSGAYCNYSATDAVSAWNITTGSAGIVIADVDTGVRFDHPDLLRAGFGGRLLPGYDFVGEDYNPTTGAALGTYLIANDGDGWDPDPSDPGDWVSATDEENTTLFPASSCGTPPVNSSWHGTRVAGVLGAITNNDLGVAGMTWGSWILPVRALGKCGGYDSDIISGMEWAAASMSPSGVPANPYPASIINLSLGGSGACPSSYQEVITSLTGLGVLVVASAGNGGTPNAPSPVDAPANCTGVLAVGGLRNVGTKVGYSSFGPEVGVSAPAGNCINSGLPCLRSIDTTTNSGTTVAQTNDYTNNENPNLGTSFSSPIVAGIAALMRSVNGNLTPGELIERIESSATAFPAGAAGLPVCPASDPTTGECTCVPGQCGAGMVDALAAVTAALNPIAAVSFPAALVAGSSFNAAGSAAACNRSIVSYAWSASGSVSIVSGAGSAQATVNPGASGGTLAVTVTDSAGASDTTTLTLTADSVTTTTGPQTAGTSACPTAIAVTPAAPTITAAFSPASVGENVSSTLTVTLSNANAFDLTQSGITVSLPSGLAVAASPAPATSCTGALASLTNTSSAATLGDANIPANGNCTLTMSVASASAGSYTINMGANALVTGPAGGNSQAATGTLTVTSPSHGGGALGWADLLVAAGVLVASRRRAWSAARRGS